MLPKPTYVVGNRLLMVTPSHADIASCFDACFFEAYLVFVFRYVFEIPVSLNNLCNLVGKGHSLAVALCLRVDLSDISVSLRSSGSVGISTPSGACLVEKTKSFEVDIGLVDGVGERCRFGIAAATFGNLCRLVERFVVVVHLHSLTRFLQNLRVVGIVVANHFLLTFGNESSKLVVFAV